SISVNGSTKSMELIDLALRSGARITLDSRAETNLVREVARSLGIRAKVRFRVRPNYDGLEEPSDFYEEPTPIRLAAQHYKPGIPTEDLLALGPEALEAPELDVTGVMVHLGRHSQNLAVWRGMVRSLVSLVAELSRSWAGWEPREIDLGGPLGLGRNGHVGDVPPGYRIGTQPLAPGRCPEGRWTSDAVRGCRRDLVRIRRDPPAGERARRPNRRCARLPRHGSVPRCVREQLQCASPASRAPRARRRGGDREAG